MWTDEILEYNGKLMKVPPRRVVPKPIQKPHPPMWIACVAPDSYEMAADRGLGVLSFARTWEQVQKSMEVYRQVCPRRSNVIPKVINEQFAGMIICHVAENKEEEQIGLEGARWFLEHVTELFRPLASKNKLYSYEYLRQLFAIDQEPRHLSDADLKQHHMVVMPRIMSDSR